MGYPFDTETEAPVKCALEISKELKNHPELRVRMGVHSGRVNEITDLNAQANIAGAGINVAQRVTDCGDAGHILLSRHVAEDLRKLRSSIRNGFALGCLGSLLERRLDDLDPVPVVYRERK